MATLAAKFDYLEKLTRKVTVTHNQDSRKRANGPFRGGGSGDGGPPKKKKNDKQKSLKTKNTFGGNGRATSKSLQKPAISQQEKQRNTQSDPLSVALEAKPNLDGVTTGKEFSALDILRQRLHQKIEESRGQGSPKDPNSEEVKRKREKRKQERERKKRKKKEFRKKRLAEKAAAKEEAMGKKDAPAPEPIPTAAKPAKRDESSIVFNKVEVGEDYVDQGTKIKEKRKQKAKGNMTPLTGRNYRQLLERVEARKTRLEDLREKDEGKAKKEEEKMRWTNVLYKAEGLKIKDDEKMLRASLKKKEKSKEQRKKKWNQRSLQVVEKMQHRQDKRRKNIQRRKQSKVDKRKQKARKRGRILPEDLKKVAS